MKKADVYLIAGQSNALGISPNNGLGELNGKVYKNIEMFLDTNTENPYAKKWLDMTTCYGFKDSMFGLEVGLSEVIEDKYSLDNKAYIIKYASDGTALYDRWNKSSTAEDYNGLVNTVKLGVEELKKKGLEADIKGLLWFQGSSDGIYKAFAPVYEQNLTQFIANIRKDVKKDLPISIAQINPNNPHVPYRHVVIEAQKKVVSNTPNCIYFETGEFNDLIDNYHYNADCMLKIGKGLANNLLKIIK